MKDCVIFSSYVPNQAAFENAKASWDAVVENFSDAKFYVGINPPVYQPWLDYVSGKGVSIKIVPDHLAVDSDASAFLAALGSYRSDFHNKNRERFHRIWIGHAKSTTSGQLEYRDIFINEFWKKRKHYEEIHDSMPWLGGLTRFSALCCDGHLRSGPCISLMGRCSGTYKPNRIMGLHSFMMLDGEIFHEFALSLQERFFEKRITDLTGFDRYLVERDIATVPSLYGKLLLPFYFVPEHGPFSMTKAGLYNEIQRWLVKNPGLTLPRTDFYYQPSESLPPYYESLDIKN